jgi:hypothetical protein
MPNSPKTVKDDRPEESSPNRVILSSEDINSDNRERQQPIPPPSNPRQYRAIGLVRGKYQISGEQLTQGALIATDGTEIEAVLLGRTISLVKNHLDLDTEHLWVVYPRTRQVDDKLHVQIVGVWEPETLHKYKQEEDTDADSLQEEVRDGYFSIRGEVVFYSTEEKSIVIKIKQAPKKEGEKAKFFKLKLKGVLSEKPLRRFWDLHVRLEGENLVIEESQDIGAIPVKKRMDSRPPRGKKPVFSRRPNDDRPLPAGRPVVKDRPLPKVETKTERPIPKPKLQKD